MPGGVRVDVSSEVLVVPPFECAWLADLPCEEGCLQFEARGETDATVILEQTSSQTFGRRNQTGQAYTFILGSHRNSTVKLERDGVICAQVACAGCLHARDFTPFWLHFSGGCFSVGRGRESGFESGEEHGQRGPALCSWTDPQPLTGAFHIGLSAWDAHVAFRRVRVAPGRPARQEAYQDTKHARQRSAVPSLFSLCTAHLQAHLDVVRACEVLCLAEALSPQLAQLEDAYVTFMAVNIQEVLMRALAGFTALPEGSLGRVLACPSLACSELGAFLALAAWADAQQGPRGCCSSREALEAWERLVPHIRFPLMAAADLQELQGHPLVLQSAKAQELVAEALQSQGGPEPAAGCQAPPGGALAVTRRRHIVASAPSPSLDRFRRRTAATAVDLLFVFDGDANGVCHYLGRGGGCGPWVNPAVAGLVTVGCSSPPCRQTDPKALVGQAFCRLNYAGPGVDARGAATAAWWRLDLPQGRALACDHYSLRADASRAFPRTWALQGSRGEDGAWVTLRQHANDAALSLPGQYASFPVTGHTARTPYTSFRVVLTGPTAAAAEGPSRNFHLAWWELYGQLSWTAPAAAAV